MHYQKLILFLSIIYLSPNLTCGQVRNESYNPKEHFRVVFYNTENLFDTEDDPRKNDNEFLPESKKKWTKERYNEKLNNIAKVLTSIGEDEYPEIIGLCEVENRKVLNDLISKTSLSKANYGIIHEDSPDRRGIDVALLYRKDEFNYISHKVFKIKFPFNNKMKTRDILYVMGTVSERDTLHIFINHWSSRIGGVSKSEPKRLEAAKILKKQVDKLFSKNADAKIIIIGDFNDEPKDKSISTVIGDKSDIENISSPGLYNMFYDKMLAGEGTYNYMGDWFLYDQIIVSLSFFNSSHFNVKKSDAYIFKPGWLLYKNKKHNYSAPSRTYGSSKYFGGYSDHLPVYVKMNVY